MPEPTVQQNAAPQANGGESAQGAMPESFEKFLEAQPEAIKGLYAQHTAGLQNTVKATRDERDALSKQLKELLPKVEKGSDAEKTLLEFQTKLEQAERRATFVEEAIKPEIGCRNPKAAYALAVADSLFNRHGGADWAAIKAAAPELFGQPSVPGNAGAGTGEPPTTKGNMNELILRAAGRR